tara:strand:+ start:2118 stop:4784 length:2667 start_codon:yes stop_codon:yes gene_type:complete
MNWYKEARMGSIGLEKVGVPSNNINQFINYLHSLPDNLQKYLFKYIRKNPLMTVEELKAIPVEKKEALSISKKMETLVKRITEDNNEREWLRGLVISGRFKEEDSVKLFNLFGKYHAISTAPEIESFKDDTALAAYISSNTVYEAVDATGEFKLVDEGTDRGRNVKMYYITDQAALDSLGGDASWCVLTANGGTDYEPFEYYMFLIDGEAEVLIHQGSSQIKDKYDGELRNGILVSLINPYIEKHNILTDMGDYDDGGDDDPDGEDEEDISAYNDVVKRINEYKMFSLSDDKDKGENMIYDYLDTLPYEFGLLPEEAWPKYVDYYGDRLLLSFDDNKEAGKYDKRKFIYDQFNVNYSDDILNSDYSSLEYLATYYKLNNAEEFERLRNAVVTSAFNVDDNLTVGRYKKIVPEVLRTDATNASFQDSRVLAFEHWKDTIMDKEAGAPPSHFPAFLKYTNCPFKEVKEDPEVLSYVRAKWADRLEHDIHTIANCPFDDMKNDPKIIKLHSDYIKREILDRGDSGRSNIRYFRTEMTNPNYIGHFIDDRDFWLEVTMANPKSYNDIPEKIEKHNHEFFMDYFIKMSLADVSFIKSEMHGSGNYRIWPYVKLILKDPRYWNTVLSQAPNFEFINELYNIVFAKQAFEFLTKETWLRILLLKPDFESDKESWAYAKIYAKCPFDEVKVDPAVLDRVGSDYAQIIIENGVFHFPEYYNEVVFSAKKFWIEFFKKDSGLEEINDYGRYLDLWSSCPFDELKFHVRAISGLFKGLTVESNTLPSSDTSDPRFLAALREEIKRRDNDYQRGWQKQLIALEKSLVGKISQDDVPQSKNPQEFIPQDDDSQEFVPQDDDSQEFVEDKGVLSSNIEDKGVLSSNVDRLWSSSFNDNIIRF